MSNLEKISLILITIGFWAVMLIPLFTLIAKISGIEIGK